MSVHRKILYIKLAITHIHTQKMCLVLRNSVWIQVTLDSPIITGSWISVRTCENLCFNVDCTLAFPLSRSAQLIFNLEIKQEPRPPFSHLNHFFLHFLTSWILSSVSFVFFFVFHFICDKVLERKKANVCGTGIFYCLCTIVWCQENWFA